MEQYHAMIQSGFLKSDDPVELLEGVLVRKMPKNPPHRVVTRLTRTRLEFLISSGWYVDSQEPITTTDSEPEPDVVVVRGNTRQYLTRHPGPQDVGLVVEVADTSLDQDRSLKKRLYARASIPIYWIISLPDEQIEVYTDPSGPIEEPDYRGLHRYSTADEVPLVLDGQEIGRIPVRELLP